MTQKRRGPTGAKLGMILRITLKYGDKIKSWFVDVIVCRRQAIWDNASIY
jgi:hypothetical protein